MGTETIGNVHTHAGTVWYAGRAGKTTPKQEELESIDTLMYIQQPRTQPSYLVQRTGGLACKKRVVMCG